MNELLDLIDRFISGDDISLKAANKIEVTLDDAFPADPTIQEVVSVLAQYRPAGGEFLFDSDEVSERLAKAREIVFRSCPLRT